MNQKDIVIEAFKGMVLTIGIVVVFYYLMKSIRKHLKMFYVKLDLKI